MYGNGGHGMMGFGFGTGGLAMILFWVVVVVVIVLAVRWLRRDDSGQRGQSRSHAALDVLEERYARGEITRDEFLSMKKDLRG